MHNGLWKLNLWAGNGSREIEEQQNRACEPVTDAPSSLLTTGVRAPGLVGGGWQGHGGGAVGLTFGACLVVPAAGHDSEAPAREQVSAYAPRGSSSQPVCTPSTPTSTAAPCPESEASLACRMGKPPPPSLPEPTLEWHPGTSMCGTFVSASVVRSHLGKS